MIPPPTKIGLRNPLVIMVQPQPHLQSVMMIITVITAIRILITMAGFEWPRLGVIVWTIILMDQGAWQAMGVVGVAAAARTLPLLLAYLRASVLHQRNGEDKRVLFELLHPLILRAYLSMGVAAI